jgi:hypothetical protein
MHKSSARHRPPQSISQPLRKPLGKVILLEPYRHKPRSPRKSDVAPVEPEAPVTKTRSVPPMLRESKIDELIRAAPKPAKPRVRVKKPKAKAEELSISRRVVQQFVAFWFDHKAGLEDYLDERVAGVIYGRRRQRLKEKAPAQVRELEFAALLGRIRTTVAAGIDTGRRTAKGYRIIRIQRGPRGAIFFATVYDRDRRLVGFYTHEYFMRPKRRKRLASRRRHSTRS